VKGHEIEGKDNERVDGGSHDEVKVEGN